MATPLLLVFAYIFCIAASLCCLPVGSSGPTVTTTQQLSNGFRASPDSSVSTFQPLVTDSAGNYSFGFLRVNKNQVALAVIHAASAETMWVANTTRSPKWSDHTHLVFNGNLVLSDSDSAALWSTGDQTGQRLYLSNTSNLQIQTTDGSVLWQSFDFPSDTIVENQNFTSNMSLVSANGIYTMRLGPNFIGLYAKFKSGSDPGQIYIRHKAMEVKANIVPGRPIYAVLKSDGFLGMYQEGQPLYVDLQSFRTYQQFISGRRRLRMEPDGNLNGYFWTGSEWSLDYQAVTDTCELPSSCGPYGLCRPDNKGCSCLNNETQSDSGRCDSHGNHNLVDFCTVYSSKYRSVRQTGVELPYKELMGYKLMQSYAQCEGECVDSCTCWGVVYSNSSGFCYIIDYPIQSLVSVRDESKMGFFKVSEGVGKDKMDIGLRVGVGVLCAVVLVCSGLVGYGWHRFRSRSKRGVSGYVKEENVGGVGPYKDLGTASFRSIELSGER